MARAAAVGAAHGRDALTAPASVASAYALALLDSLGVAPGPIVARDEHPALAWAQSGLMQLTGRPDGPPRICPVPLASCADGALAALACLAPAGALAGLSGAQLLGERAAIIGATRAGAISPGGSCRLLEAADGWLALNLARDDDWSLVPAWLEAELAPDWINIAAAVRMRRAPELVERGRSIGLAVALDAVPDGRVGWVERSETQRWDSLRSSQPTVQSHRPLVVDLSSLWAGPLCGHLLQRLGCEVVKVESQARPDGARAGPPAFFDLLNAGKASVALDFASQTGREQLRALIARADIVIEGSRPRALRQLGIDAAEMLAAHRGMTWLSITAYGRDAAHENWIGYGDDAGVAAGLSRLMFETTGEHLIVGDAVADPLTGMHAALAAWATHRSGGGLVALALSDVVRHCINWGQTAFPSEESSLTPISVIAERPRVRTPTALARPLGADTIVHLQEAARRGSGETSGEAEGGLS